MNNIFIGNSNETDVTITLAAKDSNIQQYNSDEIKVEDLVDDLQQNGFSQIFIDFGKEKQN